MQEGVVYQFSFAYDVLDAGPVELDEGVKAWELRKIDLFEVSVVPIPANPRAEVTDIKSGRRNSKADEDAIKQALRSCRSLSGGFEDADDPEDGEDDPKANGGKRRSQKASNPRRSSCWNTSKI